MGFYAFSKYGAKFNFNSTMYAQVYEVSMGSPLGPVFANIFVGYYERFLFEKYCKPHVYIDDTFFFLFSIPSKMLRPFIPNLIHFIQPFSSPWKENSCTLSFFGRTGRTERRFFHYQYLSEAYVHMFIHHIENFYS